MYSAPAQSQALFKPFMILHVAVPRGSQLKDVLQFLYVLLIVCNIGHPSNIMLKITLNGLQPQAEEIIVEEQAGFRTGRSTTILCEKYLQHQQNLYYVFIDFKKAFDSLWNLMGN